MSIEHDEQSVTQWIDEARIGDEQARFELWNRYFQRLIALARTRMDARVRRLQDEEDIACQTFQSLFDAIQKGGIHPNADREDLWRLLVAIADNKIHDARKSLFAKKRGGGKVRGHSVLEGQQNSNADGFNQLPDPSPEFADLFATAFAESFEKLSPDLLEIAQLRMLGHTNLEIAEKVGLSEESIRRKLLRIRLKWEEDQA